MTLLKHLLVISFFGIFILVITNKFFNPYQSRVEKIMMLQCDDDYVIQEIKNQIKNNELSKIELELHSSKINSVKFIDNKYKSMYCISSFYKKEEEKLLKYEVHYKITNFISKFDISLIKIQGT